MKKDYLHINLSNAWTYALGVYAIGHAYLENESLDASALANYFASVANLDDFVKYLRPLNGIFSVVLCNENITAAAIDSTRIYPVYYTLTDGKWLITDNPYSLLNENHIISKTSLEQLRSSFAVLEGRTLIEGIYQVKPSSAIEFSSSAVSNEVRYFHYNVSPEQVKKSDVSSLLEVLTNAVKRLIKRANGRQIVVPMSAGYDSRIILCLLKENGYKNVLTYTMGSNDKGSEVSVASIVSKTLGYPHFQIDLNLVGKEYDFSDFKDYVKHEGGLTNFSWCEEYVCVKYLQKRGLLHQDAIFAHGHAGDFFAGSHLQKSLINEDSSIRELIRGILFNNFEASYNLNTAFIRKEFDSLKPYGTYAPSLYNAFIFNNRLSHFISNSSRTYTFFGYEVFFPLWDKEFIELMRKLPFEQLNYCALYNEAVEGVFERNDVNFKKELKPIKVYRNQYIKNVIRVILPSKFLFLKKRPIDILGGFHLANILCEDFIVLSKNASKPYCINSCLTEWYVEKVKELINKSI